MNNLPALESYWIWNACGADVMCFLAGILQGGGCILVWGGPVGASKLAAALGGAERLSGESKSSCNGGVLLQNILNLARIVLDILDLVGLVSGAVQTALDHVVRGRN